MTGKCVEQHFLFGVVDRLLLGILAKFDSRLVKLEKTIRPLHTATQSLTRLATSTSKYFKLKRVFYLKHKLDIDRTMESINAMASEKQDVVAEENLVLRGYVVYQSYVS